jgi:hypothetical protein
MAEQECPHGFSDARFCADCTPKPKPEEPETPIHSTAVKAQYRGRCVECRDPIEVGEWIVPDSRGGWDHDECA